MPYTTLPDGTVKFDVSRWTKDDLPTWHELYYEFYVPEAYDYVPSHYQIMDPYWKIPRRLYLLATGCNQLNKILVEDRRHDEALRFMNDLFVYDYEKISFRLSPVLPVDQLDSDPIYELPHPKGEKNIFAVKDVEYRVDMRDMIGSPIALKLCAFTNNRMSVPPYMVMTDMITYILQSVISYFKGNVGWE